jgi:phosphoribosyl 1,2-cyclic phosphodiesterase
LRVCLLASGSKGNAVYVESRESSLLIDAGLSARELKSRLALLGRDGESLDGLLVTHEHSDHCRGLGPLARSCRLPVFVQTETRQALPNPGRLDDLREFDGAEAFTWRDLQIDPFPLTHDAVAPVGYTINTAEGKIGIATDLGIATRLVFERLKGCRVLILESNHDEEMLRDGPYPWHLKQRIRSNHGHLSNTASAHLLQSLLWDGLEAVFLAHLSETNNHPGLAESCAKEILSRQNLCKPQLIVGCQDHPSLCFASEKA